MHLLLLFFILGSPMFAADFGENFGVISASENYPVSCLQEKLSLAEMNKPLEHIIDVLELLVHTEKNKTLLYSEKIEYESRLRKARERLALKKRLPQLEQSGSHDEVIDVLSLLLKDKASKGFERSEYTQKLKEAFLYKAMSDFFDNPTDEFLSIVKKYSRGSESYVKACAGEYDDIIKIFAHFKGKNLSYAQQERQAIVVTYWLDKLSKHKNFQNADDSFQHYVKNGLRYHYDQIRHKAKKCALFLEQKENAQAGEKVMPVCEFIRVYADEIWLESMCKHANEIAPETFIGAKKRIPSNMQSLACIFEEEGMPCGAMYWFEQAANLEKEEIEEGHGQLAQIKRQTLYEAILK